MIESMLIFLAAFVAAAISGAAGFGGALLMLPFLVATVGATHAVPLLTIAQVIGNLSRSGLGVRQIQWKPVGLFLLGALPLSILGAISFVKLPKDLVTRSIGVSILFFVALKYFGILKLKANPALLVVGGGVTGFLSGLVGSAGPLGAAIFLSLNLSPVGYVASEAMTALAIHAMKTVVYQKYIILGREFWLLAVLMGIAMIFGTWSAKRIIERVPKAKFQRYVSLLLVVIAAYMVIHG